MSVIGPECVLTLKFTHPLSQKGGAQKPLAGSFSKALLPKELHTAKVQTG